MEPNETSSEKTEAQSRIKTKLRHRYEAEAQEILKKIGTLEEVRGKLRLNQRAMAASLLVDPSAWTRWTTGITSPPPHVVRTLELMLMSLDMHPDLDTEGLLRKSEAHAKTVREVEKLDDRLQKLESNPQVAALRAKTSHLESRLHHQIEDLKTEISELNASNRARSRRYAIGLGVLFVMNLVWIVIYLL